MTTAPVCNKIKAINPVTVTMPNGTRVASTHECKLDIPLLPQAARFGHILPSLMKYSTILVVKLCNAGCEVQFRNISCVERHCGRIIMAGNKCQRTGLWFVPLTGTEQNDQSKVQNTSPVPTPTQQIHHVLNHVTPALQPPPGFEKIRPKMIKPPSGFETVIPGPPFSFNNVSGRCPGFIQPNRQIVCQSMLATVHQMHHAHDTSTKAELAEYHHQSLPPPNASQRHQ